MRVADFRRLLDAAVAQGDVLVAVPGGRYDVVAVHGDAHDLVLEIVQRPVPVIRRRKRRKPAA
jgi:hypothetical protein